MRASNIESAGLSEPAVLIQVPHRRQSYCRRFRNRTEPVLRPALGRNGDRRDLAEARPDLAAWLAKWSGKFPRLTK
jgi:hypothetical protein